MMWIPAGKTPAHHNCAMTISQPVDYAELLPGLGLHWANEQSSYPELSTPLILVYLYEPKDFPRGKAG